MSQLGVIGVDAKPGRKGEVFSRFSPQSFSPQSHGGPRGAVCSEGIPAGASGCSRRVPAAVSERGAGHSGEGTGPGKALLEMPLLG